MSIARNFVLAGVPAVIETLWPVEDLSGSKIMISYYKHLSEGKEKNTALRLAKLDYILNTSPSFVNPRFWAAYTLLGDTAPLRNTWWNLNTKLFYTSIILSLLVLFLSFYGLRSLRTKRALFL